MPSKELAADDIGGRVRFVRKRRGLSLDVAAGLAGMTKSHLSMLERGERRFDRRGLLDRLADVLGCSVADLTGQPYLLADPADAEMTLALPAIARAVFDCDLDDPPDVPARPVSALVALASLANDHLDKAVFSAAVRDLGPVIAELHVAANDPSEAVRRAALAALAEACMVATATARHLGRPELAVHTARRGHEAAARLEDQALVGQLAVQRALGLSWIGAQRKVTSVLDDALRAVGPVNGGDETTLAETAGTLHLTAAWHHAQLDGGASTAADHMGHAAELARQTGERNWMRMHFGPAHVRAWGLEVAVELERGVDEVEQIAAEVDQLSDTLESRNRRCVLHFNLARAYAQAEGSRDAEALRHLDMADRIAPQGLRSVPVAHEVLHALDQRAQLRVWELSSLKNRMRISG